MRRQARRSTGGRRLRKLSTRSARVTCTGGGRTPADCQRADDGRAAARKRGVHMGRKPKLTELQCRVARERVAKGESAPSIAQECARRADQLRSFEEPSAIDMSVRGQGAPHVSASRHEADRVAVVPSTGKECHQQTLGNQLSVTFFSQGFCDCSSGFLPIVGMSCP
jgi:hypothetical protein